MVLEALAAGRRCRCWCCCRAGVDQGIAHLARLARVLGVQDSEPAKALIRRGYGLRGAGASPAGPRAFVPIWMDPLMTLNADTFGSDVLAQVGIGECVWRLAAAVSAGGGLKGKTAPQDAGGARRAGIRG